MEKFQIEGQGSGEYRVHVDSRDGSTSLTILLLDAVSASGGRLTDDVDTARAAFEFLLRHQDASDLPEQIDIQDVIAAYADALDEIEVLRE